MKEEEKKIVEVDTVDQFNKPANIYFETEEDVEWSEANEEESIDDGLDKFESVVIQKSVPRTKNILKEYKEVQKITK